MQKTTKHRSGKAIPSQHLNCTHSESQGYYYCRDLHHLL